MASFLPLGDQVTAETFCMPSIAGVRFLKYLSCMEPKFEFVVFLGIKRLYFFYFKSENLNRCGFFNVSFIFNNIAIDNMANADEQ